MNENNLKKLASAMALGTIITVVFIVSVTIGGELYAPLKNWLKNTFSHHWLGKSIISILVFVLVTLVSYATTNFTNDERLAKRIWFMFWMLLLGATAVVGFFTYEYLKH